MNTKIETLKKDGKFEKTSYILASIVVVLLVAGFIFS
jgi:hypothetical protein